MDGRRTLTLEQVGKVHKLIDEGMTLESVGRKFGISSSQVQRLKAAHQRGEVKVYPSSLSSCTKFIAKGLPFKRTCCSNYYYFYDLENHWFIKHRYVDDGDDYDIIEYTLNLTLEGLMAKDWVVLTWESVK